MTEVKFMNPEEGGGIIGDPENAPLDKDFVRRRTLIGWVGEQSRQATAWLSLASLLVIMAFDYGTGVDVNVTLFYLVPVFLVTWRIDRRMGIFTSLVCAVAWSAVDTMGRKDISSATVLWNVWIQFALFITFSFVVSRIKEILNAQNALNRELHAALAEVKNLSGLLPMCAWCRKIRDEEGNWMTLEAYMSEHSAADFTHGICPTCLADRGRK